MNGVESEVLIVSVLFSRTLSEYSDFRLEKGSTGTGDGLYIYVCARSGEMSVEDGVRCRFGIAR